MVSVQCDCAWDAAEEAEIYLTISAVDVVVAAAVVEALKLAAVMTQEAL